MSESRCWRKTGELKGVASRAKGVSHGLEGVVARDLRPVSIEEAIGKRYLEMSGADSSKLVHYRRANEDRKRTIEAKIIHCMQERPSQALGDAVESVHSWVSFDQRGWTEVQTLQGM